MESKITTKDVEAFWNEHPCESDRSHSSDRKDYFEEIARVRYSHIRHYRHVPRFDAFRGKKVLEIGCGVGTDGRQFAKNGAIYTGINLDEGSTRLAREGFELFGLDGDIRQMNAENLEFENETFDHIFSLGVIHHSPNTERIVQEMYRVLKPSGTVAVMVYNRSSINYYFEIMFLRKLFKYLLYPGFAPQALSKLGFSEYKLQRHREIMLSRKLTKDEWISINTDGPDNPLSKVYSAREGRKLFADAGFTDINTFARFFDKTHYGKLGKLLPNRLCDAIGAVAGWNRWVEARKPTGAAS